MEKASRAIRRSGVKLLSIPGGHGDLNMLVSEIKDIRHSAKLLMNAQHIVWICHDAAFYRETKDEIFKNLLTNASQDMMKWAANEENRAIQDVISQVAELNLMWTEVQKMFIEQLKEYRHMFEQVLEGEKKVSEAKTNLNYCEEKEMKVKKEFKRVAKRATASEMHIFENKVSCAEKSREMAELELTERLRENEAIKLIQIKSGMMKISETYIEMASKCNVLFSAQKNVVQQIPDVHTQEIEAIKYTDWSNLREVADSNWAGTTRFIVQQAREKLEKYNQGTSKDPPPPYTPPEPGSGLGTRAEMAPQPAPRRSGGRDSNLAPVSNITHTNHDSKDSSATEMKIQHTHKLVVKMVEKPGKDSQSQSTEFGEVSTGEMLDSHTDDSDNVADGNDQAKSSSLYPSLSHDANDSSQIAKEKPVPAPRPRQSNSAADAPVDIGDKNKSKQDDISRDTEQVDLVKDESGIPRLQMKDATDSENMEQNNGSNDDDKNHKTVEEEKYCKAEVLDDAKGDSVSNSKDETKFVDKSEQIAENAG